MHILQERGPWGQTALHVSTFWPQGMHLIFELAGESVEDVINIEDDDGKTALDYAVNLREFDSVIILVIHGNVEMDIEDASNLFKLQDSRPSQETLDFFAHLLVDGRRHLYHLAAPILRFKKRQKRRTPSFNLDPILQESAFIVVKLLAAMGFGIPIGFRHVQPGSIYHSLYSPSVELLEAIYKAGFSRTNVSYLGFHPLMTMKMHQPLRTCAFGPLEKICDDTTALLEVIIWFVDHGADLGRPIPRAAIIGSLEYHDEDRQFRMIHQLSEELGHFMGAPLAETDNVEQPLTSMLCEMVTSPDVDPCTCLCSPGGCTAISVFARKSHDNHSLRKNEAVRVIASLDPDSEDTPRVVSGLLRLTIFEQLGMRHTCCKYIHEGRGRYNRGEMIMAGEYQILELKDPEEIAELQEEDKHLSERLEELVLEFDEQYRSLGKPFIEFFTEYVEPRMDEIDAEEESLSPEEEEAIRNTGVILHDTRDQVEREFSCDDMTDIAQA